MDKLESMLPKRPALFTPEDIKKYGLTAEDVELLEQAEDICREAELLPESDKDIDALLKKMDKTFPDSVEGTINKMAELVEKDPELFKQIYAMYELSNLVSEVPPPETGKISEAELKKAKTAKLVDEITGK